MGKALGFGVARAFAWKEIEIVGRPKPSVTPLGRVAAWAERVGAGSIDLSMTHSRELASAVCVVADAESLYSAAEMRAAEAGHEVAALMERAGAAVAREVLQHYPEARRLAVVCGGGQRRRRPHRRQDPARGGARRGRDDRGRAGRCDRGRPLRDGLPGGRRARRRRQRSSGSTPRRRRSSRSTCRRAWTRRPERSPGRPSRRADGHLPRPQGRASRSRRGSSTRARSWWRTSGSSPRRRSCGS